MNDVGEIEKGVPIPQPKSNRLGAVARQLLACEIGDSFTVRGNGIETVRSFARHRGIVIVTRGVSGCDEVWRVWRKS
jgi:hypothetical protein